MSRTRFAHKEGPGFNFSRRAPEFVPDPQHGRNGFNEDSSRVIGRASANTLVSSRISTMGSMAVMPVLLRNSQGREIRTSVFLDSGSSISFCTRSLLESLNVRSCDVSEVNLCTQTIHSQKIERTRRVSGIKARGEFENLWINLPALYVVEKIPISKEDAWKEECDRKWPHLHDLTLSRIEDIGVMLGSDALEAQEPLEVRRAPRVGAPYGVRTRLGWSVTGLIRCVESGLKNFRIEMPGVSEIEVMNGEAVRGEHGENCEVVRGEHGEDCEAVRGEHGEDCEAVRGEHGENCEAVRGEHGENCEAVRGEHGEDCEAVRVEHDEDCEAVRGEHGEDCEAVRGEHGEDCEAVRGEHGEDCEAVRGEHDEYCEAVRGEHGEDCEAVRGEHDEDCEAVRGEHVEDCEAVRGEHGEDCEAVRGEHGEDCEVVRGEHDEDCEAVRGEHGEDCEAVRGEHGEDCEAVRGEHGEDCEAVRGEHGEDCEVVRGEHGEDCEAVRGEHGKDCEAVRGEHGEDCEAVRGEPGENSKWARDECGVQCEVMNGKHGGKYCKGGERVNGERDKVCGLTEEACSEVEGVKGDAKDPNTKSFQSRSGLSEDCSSVLVIETER